MHLFRPINLTPGSIDPKLPFLETALDLQAATSQFQAISPDIHGVTAANLVRHKMGRRALIEYHLDTDQGPLTLLGKVHRKGIDYTSYRIQQTLWDQGFDANSADGYSVPEPMGIIPDWHMWLQCKVPGVSLTELLPTPAGLALGRRIATLAHKLHCTPVSIVKRHTLTDELDILYARLPQVAQQHPPWQSRIAKILTACDTLVHRRLVDLAAESTSPAPWVGIHRDFYSDQILVHGDRLWLVDLDLYCQGHPALDIGNFIAHITEQSLRQTGNAVAMADRETALRDAFVEVCSSPCLSAEVLRYEIELYTVLTLVRHIHISRRIVARHRCTEDILVLCEKRLQQLTDSA